MRKFFSIFIVFALIVSIGFPSASHAMMTHEGKLDQKTFSDESSAKNHDCHKGEYEKQTQNIAQNNKSESSKCCEKGSCKCVGSTCHNALSKILNNYDVISANPSQDSEVFVMNDDFVKSSFYSRLKRPPKA